MWNSKSITQIEWAQLMNKEAIESGYLVVFEDLIKS